MKMRLRYTRLILTSSYKILIYFLSITGPLRV